MKQRNLLLILVLTIFTISSAFAAKPKAKHVVWIGLDGWGAYSVEKAEMPCHQTIYERGLLYVEETFRTTFIQCCKLGIHVHGGRAGDSRIH